MAKQKRNKSYKGYMAKEFFLSGDKQDDGEWVAYVYSPKHCSKEDLMAFMSNKTMVPVKVTRTASSITIVAE